MRDYWIPDTGSCTVITSVSVVGFLDEGLLGYSSDEALATMEFQWLDF